MQKFIYATNSESESRGFYTGEGKLIYANQENDDLTFMLKALADYLGVKVEFHSMPEVDGSYPENLFDKRKTRR